MIFWIFTLTNTIITLNLHILCYLVFTGGNFGEIFSLHYFTLPQNESLLSSHLWNYDLQSSQTPGEDPIRGGTGTWPILSWDPLVCGTCNKGFAVWTLANLVQLHPKLTHWKKHLLQVITIQNFQLNMVLKAVGQIVVKNIYNNNNWCKNKIIQ